MRPDTTTGVGSQPASLLPHCANCGDPADIELGDQQACLNCFGLALKGVSR